MAAFESTKFIPFVFPPSKPRSCNNNSLWPAKNSRSSNQTVRKPAGSFSHSADQVKVDRNTVARAEGCKHACTVSDNESDDDFPSLEELTRAALPPKILTEPSKIGPTLQLPEQPALQRAGLQVDQAQLGLGKYLGGSRDQPMILDNDDDLDEAGARGQAKGASNDIDIERNKRDASLHATFATSELGSAPTESIDASGPWYDVEEGRYIEEPALGIRPHERHGIPSAPAQAQPQTLPQPSALQQDQTNQQSVGSIAQSASVQSTLHSLPKLSDSGDDGWTDNDTAELEKELGLALEEQQVESLSAGTPTCPSPHSVEAPQSEIQSREHTETAGGILEELRDASRHSSPAQDLEGWEPQETQVERGAVVVLQQEELGQPADEQDLVEVVDLDDSKNKEAAEDPPTTQPEIDRNDERRFRLRGVRTRQLPGRQTKTTQYQLVWGQRPNRLDSWLNEDDVQISMPYVSNTQDLALPIRVRKIRSTQRRGRKVFEYLVDAFDLDNSTWTTEDQLGISLSPMLVLELKGSSLSEAQRDVLLRHSATLIRDEHGSASRASRSFSASADPALEGEPATRKRGHQDAHTEISSDTHRSTNTDNRDTDDEDPRPAKRRKPRSAPAMTPPPHVRRSCPFESTSTTSLEIDDMQPQADFGCPSTLVDDEHQYTPQTSRRPPASVKSAPIVEYQEWPFQGFLKRTKIGNETTFNLEFQLSHIPEHIRLPVLSEALGMHSNKDTSTDAATSHDTDAHSTMHPAAVRPQIKRVRWAPEEDATILKMREEDGCSWEEIHAALPHRTQGTIQVRYSTKLKK